VEFEAKFIELDIDMVLQGHNHVFSRGQVANNINMGNQQLVQDRRFADFNVPKAPLYLIPSAAGMSKFYTFNVSAHNQNPNFYDFLDISSAFPVGSSLNPFGPQTRPLFNETLGYPTFIEVTVNRDFIRFNTYKYPCSTETFEPTGELFLFDSYTLYRTQALLNAALSA